MEHSVLNGCPHQTPLPSGLRKLWRNFGRAERLQKPEGMEDSTKTASRHSRNDAHMNSQILWQHALGLHRFTPVRVPVLRRGSDEEIQTLARKLSAIDTRLQRERQFSPVESHWIYKPYLRKDRPHPKSRWPPQDELRVIFVSLSCLGNFYFIDLFLINYGF